MNLRARLGRAMNDLDKAVETANQDAVVAAQKKIQKIQNLLNN